MSALVRQAATEGTRIRAVGSALSWSDAIDIPGEAMRFDQMARVLDVDPVGERIRLQGGATLDVVNRVLAQNGLALDNFGSITRQTVAGYLGTASHGTGGRTQLLSSQVAGLRLVDGIGNVHELDSDREPQLFRAACAHLGCLGIITEVSLRCVEAFDLEERLEHVDVDTALANLDAYVDGNDYCKLWWLPYTDHFLVYTWNKTTKSRTRPALRGLMDRSGLSGSVFGGLTRLIRAFPRTAPFILEKVQRLGFSPGVRVGRSDEIMPYSGSIPIHQETEYAIPRNHAATAIDQVRTMVLDADAYRVNFPFEVRFAAADQTPMSPAYRKDVCYLGAYVASRKWAAGYFADFEELVRDYQGRPHWGKTFTRTADELRSLFPAYEEFEQHRRQLDPAGVFRNSFVDRVFPTEDDPY